MNSFHLINCFWSPLNFKWHEKLVFKRNISKVLLSMQSSFSGCCCFDSVSCLYGKERKNGEKEFWWPFLSKISIQILEMLLEKQKKISWAALHYLTGEVAYGGRVTDSWDRRCLLSILDNFYNPSVLQEDFAYSMDWVCKLFIFFSFVHKACIFKAWKRWACVVWRRNNYIGEGRRSIALPVFGSLLTQNMNETGSLLP